MSKKFSSEKEELNHIATITNERVVELSEKLALYNRLWRVGKIAFVKKTLEQNRLLRAVALQRITKIGA